ncbi:hypothetical protein JZO73_10210 [Enterococcus plantarum]|uniref:Uncharacterized protein n=1 Tax=Enterococcus plantarum TaxID=1077675 RepID=A0A2W4BMX9_9ENTE|nr:hypothetical protein [Enterococcus plantarum]MBO0467903.1 hypothetical protein [Enterococcus plantarum]PZL74079.1 hypothetical protein CI088_07720 [Enterococcus plantarum]
MKNITFSRIKLKNYFLALTYFLVGVGVSTKIPAEFLFIILGVYLTVAFFHIKEMVHARNERREYEHDWED